MEEAKRRFLETGGFSFSPCGGSKLTNFEPILEELKELSQRHANEYFRQNQQMNLNSLSEEDLKTTQESAVEMYRILIIPEKTLKAYFESLGSEILKKEFKRIAILIHPDKNNHPNSKVAFQKLYNNFVGVLCPNN